MEVHHHPNVEKKNFKEYFFEFLMIFLAITMSSYKKYMCRKSADNIFWLKPGSIFCVPPSKAGGNPGRA